MFLYRQCREVLLPKLHGPTVTLYSMVKRRTRTVSKLYHFGECWFSINCDVCIRHLAASPILGLVSTISIATAIQYVPNTNTVLTMFQFKYLLNGLYNELYKHIRERWSMPGPSAAS